MKKIALVSGTIWQRLKLTGYATSNRHKVSSLCLIKASVLRVTRGHFCVKLQAMYETQLKTAGSSRRLIICNCAKECGFYEYGAVNGRSLSFIKISLLFRQQWMPY